MRPIAEPRRWTSAEVRQLIDESPMYGPRYELIDGELLVSPAPGRTHERAVAWFLASLEPFVERERLGDVLPSPADVELAPDTISQPDLFVVPSAHAGAVNWAPVSRIILSIEVVSPKTAKADRGRKRTHYLSAGVNEYWIVDLDARVIERWRAAGDEPDMESSALRWNPAGASCPLVLELSRLWITAPAERGN
jgi:Uma2 family endonuclease